MNEETRPLSTEERIQALEARVKVLENIEAKRKRKMIISIVVKVVFYLIILIAMYRLFLYVKPYFDQLTHANDIRNSLGNYDLNSYLEEFQNMFNY